MTPQGRKPNWINKRTLVVCSLFVIFVFTLKSRPYQYVQFNVTPEQDADSFVNACQGIEGRKDDDPELVACLRQDYLHPPSILPYDFSHPNQAPTEQSLIALKLLKNMKNGFFVECGAFDGETASNSLRLELDYGWSGILIEAESNNHKSLLQKHRKTWSSNSCFSPKTTAQKLTLRGIDEYHAGGLTLMTDSVPLQKFEPYVNAQRSQAAEVQCFPVYTYLLALNRTVVDYFSLDTEGADFEILKTIPFDKVIFKVLEVEVAWVNEGAAAVRKFLESKGYVFVKDVGGIDYIFVHKSLNLPKDLKI